MNLNLPPAVQNIIIINVIVFLACMVMPSIEPVLTGYYFESANFRPWQIVTHLFMHGGVAHIFFNMYALFLFGPSLEYRWGTKRFLVYYFVSGIGAFFLHFGINYYEVHQLMAQMSEPNVAEVVINGTANLNQGLQYANHQMAQLNDMMNAGVVGASGAVFGVLLAFGMLFPNLELMLLFPPVALRAKYMVMIYGGLEVFLAIQNSASDNVAHFAHIGGMLFGFLLLKYWQSIDRR